MSEHTPTTDDVSWQYRVKRVHDGTSDAALAVAARMQAEAWQEGHDTDEHGWDRCECPNPYSAHLEEA